MNIHITKKNATAFYTVIQALYFFMLAIVNVYASAFLLNRGFTNGQIGIMLGIGNLGAVGIQLLSASVITRTGIRIGKVMIGTCVVIVVLALMMLLLPLRGVSFCVAYVLVFMLAQSMMSSVNSLYRGYHEKGTKINFGVARGFGSAAYSIASLSVGLVVQRFTPDILPGLYVVPCLLLGIVVFIFNAPNVTERQSSSVTSREKRIFMREYPQFYLFFAGVLCLSISNGFTETYLLQIIRRVGGDSSNLGVAMFISAMTELPAMLLYRHFANKIGNRRLLVLAGWMWAAKNFLIMLAPNVYLIYAAELIQFGGYAIYVPAGVRYIAHTLPESEFLKGQALVGSAFTAGCLVAGFVGGPMIDMVGLGATLCGVQVFSIGGVILFSCAMTKSLHMFPSEVGKAAPRDTTVE